MAVANERKELQNHLGIRQGSVYFCAATCAFLSLTISLSRICVSQTVPQGQETVASTAVETFVPAPPTANQLGPEELGDLHLARKRYQAAIAAYRLAPPSSPAVWNKLGMANQQMYIMSEAKKDYETSLKLDPTNPDVLNNLATVYYSMKEYSIAERYYRKALKLGTKSAVIYKNLGTDLLAQDKFQKGWECYQTALAIDPEVFENSNQFRIGEPTPTHKRGAMNYFLAKSYAKLGIADRAIAYLQMAINEGFADRKKVMADTEFASLRDLYAFQKLFAEQRNQ
jgi:Tfp pilus assembly protein PilF